MKVKTSDLIGPALDWAVAMCEDASTDYLSGFNPSSEWSLAGPIIEREGIAIRQSNGRWYAVQSADLGDGERAPWCKVTFRNAPKSGRQCRFDAESALVAAMRCYVASKIGDVVEIPTEVTDAQE